MEMIYSKFPQHVYMTVAGVVSVREQDWIVISYSVLQKISWMCMAMNCLTHQ